MKENFKKLTPHFIAIAVFLAIGAFFFMPALQGYRLKQGDMKNATGILQEAQFYNAEKGGNVLWTNSTFSGMPTFQTSADYEGDWVSVIQKVIINILPQPAGIWLMYALSFYVLLLVLRVKPWLAIVGALSFAFSSYFIVILEVGHITKAMAVAYAPLILAGLVLTYRKSYLLGAALTGLAFGLELYSNHVQVTYYFGIVFLFYVIAQFIEAVMTKEFGHFIKASAISLVAIVIGVLCNFANLHTTYDYGKQTTRGKSELTIKSDGSSNKEIKTEGLDRDYVTAWSYGLGESWTLLIPNSKGGSTAAIGPDNSALRKADPQFQQNIAQSNQYWGDQSFTEGPVYIGAGICLLFVLGMVFLSGYLRWVMLAGAVLSLMLSWGKNFMGLTDFFLDYVPGYNKFRAVTIILVVLEFCVPVVAILFVNELINKREDWLLRKKQFLYVGAGVTGVLLAFLAIPDSLLSFISTAEQEGLTQQAAQSPEMAQTIQSYIASLKNVRIAIFKADVWRSLLIVLATFGLVYAYLTKGFKSTILVAGLGLLMLIDLVPVNRRYLNTEKENGKYVQWEEASDNKYPYQPTAADLDILKSELSANPVETASVPSDLPKTAFGRPDAIVKQINEKVAQRQAEKRNQGIGNSAVEGGEMASIQFGILGLNSNYRVFNLTVSPFNDASTSYFHKSVGGYHGAKLKRYQELIEFHLSNPINPEVLNMLNTKYVITQQGLQVNPGAAGNAWFVGNVKMVKNADEEILALKEFKAKETAIVDQNFSKLVKALVLDSMAVIKQVSYEPNHLIYESNARLDQLAVFSEIYYPGWQALIDGKPVDHFRCNYVLRGLLIPAGKHKIEFKFQPEYVRKSENVTYAGSIGLVLLLSLGAFAAWKENKRTA